MADSDQPAGGRGPVRLAFDRVAVARGGRRLLGDLSFALAAGGAALVVGANGVGKSSLIRVAAGLLPPAAGVVSRHGRVGLLTEATALDDDRPLAAALGFWARLDGNPDGVVGALAATGLRELAEVPVRLLSSGQRRRAAIARVIVADAPVWLLDEPANGLDAASVAMLEMLVERHRAGGGITLVATHLPITLPGAIELALDRAPQG